MQRTVVTFDASLDDDAELDESGDVRRPAGKHIAQELAGFLRELGLEVEGPEQHSYYGWNVFGAGNKRFWLLLQEGGRPWLLTCEEQHLFRAKDNVAMSLAEFIEQLHNWLSKDERFQGLRWYTRKEFEQNESGVASPS